ncbi:FG-GAP repeat protein [Mycoplana dimorpha]|uniref:FG-GAP repeat protein n=1 Tax=Mycoplana dimorpha TaxID=28320 RepID=A0A2T5ATY4_MYCDI|nr:integrin alpha [Mycoplana dimorpha]PTM90177.1 FG-GAP repeat protein [Mycoplana dimorpha]
MKAALLFSIATMLPSGAMAMDFPADRIVAAATGDWNRDGRTDLVVIAAPGEGEDEDNGVYIYLADPNESRLKPKVAAPNKLWGSLAMFGQEPAVAALPNGSIQLTSQNSAVGRDRWSQNLTLAWRNAQFVVAGYRYASRDTLAPGNSTDCDLNVLTGKGMANGKPIAVPAVQIAFEGWDDEIGRKACGLASR